MHSAWPRFWMGGGKERGRLLAGNFLATFSVERVEDWRRRVAEMLDFGGVKEEEGTSRSKERTTSSIL